MRQNTAILYSETSRARYAEQAQAQNKIYSFRGASGAVHWLKEEYAYLAMNGVAAFLRRLGIKHDVITEVEATADALAAYHTIFVPNAQYLLDSTIAQLIGWAHGANFLVVSGKTNLPNDFLGLETSRLYAPRGFTGIQWGDAHVAHEFTITGTPGYRVPLVTARPQCIALGRMREFTGNLADSTTAEKIDLKSDAIVVTPNAVYFAPQVFEFFGAALQAHINIQPILGWGDRYQLLDAFAGQLYQVLRQFAGENFTAVRLKPWGEHNRVVVLRHDVDGSDDLDYLNYEIENKIPATYAITLEKHKEKWLRETAKADFIESCFHYYTIPAISPLHSLLVQLDQRLKLPLRARRYKGMATGKALEQQIRVAEQRHGIRGLTAQRHYDYFYYPESIDAMDYLYEQNTPLLGLGAMFRFTNYRYGSTWINGDAGYSVNHPDVSVPFWFPFKMIVASQEKHNTLRGWDSGQVIEPDPEMVDRLLDSDLLENGVYTFGFHPAHTHRDIFNPGGNWAWFLHAVQKAQARGAWFASCRMAYEQLNNWEALALRLDGNRLALENPTERTLSAVIKTQQPIAPRQFADPRVRLIKPDEIRVEDLDPFSTLEIELAFG